MDWVAVAATFGAVQAAILTAAMVWIAMKLHRIDTNTKAIWSFLMRRAAVKAVQSGLGTMNSPIVIKPEVLQLLKPLESELKAIYEKNKKLADDALLLEIERTLGEKIVKNVCLIHGISDGECLIIALAVAKRAHGA